MNAMTAAMTLDHSSSVAYDERFQLNADPQSVFMFMELIATDADFQQSFVENPNDTLEALDLPPINLPAGGLDVSDRALTAEEKQAFIELAQIVQDPAIGAALRNSTATIEGFEPMLILALPAAVAVAVWLWLWIG
jgi:hypothetical protein